MTALPNDYDDNPAHADLPCRSRVGDTHEVVAARLVAERRAPVLDLACGRGRLAGLLRPASDWIGLDRSPAQLAHAPLPKLRGDGAVLPFADGTFAAVAALWCLYHFDDPTQPLVEAQRVLRPGGLFVTCTTARDDSPEVCTSSPATTFDAEEAVDIVASVFGADAVEVVRWDAPVRPPRRRSCRRRVRRRPPRSRRSSGDPSRRPSTSPSGACSSGRGRRRRALVPHGRRHRDPGGASRPPADHRRGRSGLRPHAAHRRRRRRRSRSSSTPPPSSSASAPAVGTSCIGTSAATRGRSRDPGTS